MNSLTKQAIAVLVISAIATGGGCQYRQSHAMEGAMGMIFGGGTSAYTIAGWAMGLGILAFLVGIGLLIAGLVKSGGSNPEDRPPR